MARMTSVEMLERLVGFDTTSRNSNLEAIGFIKDYLAGHGVESLLSHNPEGDKACLYATIGPQDRPGVALSGHLDVVPVDGQAWTSDPFRLKRRDGRLFGRGACDMKGFVATMLAMVPEFQAAPLKEPVHLCISFDEEIGCQGVGYMIDDILKRPVKPRICIVGEPSQMKPVIAHKGKLSLIATVAGLPGHSSMTNRCVNALEAAAEAVAFLKSTARRFRDQGPYDAGFDPPYTSVHTGVFQSGSALNVVPHEARFIFEWRYLPGTDVEALFAEVRAHCERAIEPEMKAVSPEAGFSWARYARIPALGLPEKHALTDMVKALTGSNSTGKVSYGTEGGLFQEAGIPTIVCGPGAIAQAHQPDEFIAESEIAACERFLRRLVETLTQ